MPGDKGPGLPTPLNDTRWRNTFSALSEPNGFPLDLTTYQPDLTTATVSYDAGTRTMTVTPTAGSFDVWVAGNLLSIGAAISQTHGNVEGLHYFYIDGDGALQTTQTFTEVLIGGYALVQVVYWSVSLATNIYRGEERHGCAMPGVVHYWLHAYQGTQYREGLALGNFDADGSGADNSNAQFSCANGSIDDEDLRTTITDGSPQDLSPILEAPIFYRVGANGYWEKDVAGSYACKRYGVSRLAWNNENAGGTGVWGQSEVANNGFVLVHVWATNDVFTPIIAIQGQAEYGNVSAAREGASTELNELILSGLPSPEFSPLGSIIFQTSNGYGNAVKARVRTTDGSSNYVSWLGADRASTGTPASHSSLSNLDADDHLGYARLTGRSGGQTYIGGSDGGDDLTLKSTDDVTLGDVIVADSGRLKIESADLQLDGGAQNDFIWRMRARVTLVGGGGWQTIRTITPSTVLGIYTEGAIRVWVGGDTLHVGPFHSIGSRDFYHYFQINNAAPTTGAYRADYTNGSPPQVRLNVSGNSIQIQVDSDDTISPARFMIDIEVRAPQDYTGGLTYTVN